MTANVPKRIGKKINKKGSTLRSFKGATFFLFFCVAFKQKDNAKDSLFWVNYKGCAHKVEGWNAHNTTRRWMPKFKHARRSGRGHTHQINPSAPFFNSDKNKSIQSKKYARVQIKSRERVGKEGGRDEKAPFLRKVYHKRNSKVSITHQRPFRCLFPALFASNKWKAVRGEKKEENLTVSHGGMRGRLSQKHWWIIHLARWI